ncbi:hypothetical protein RRG08_048735 [Elysia crispata]|uniref:Uncharacterized protein n=1 Tax=Elysia crispata TaxID=231223 RepID=A0AAE1D7B9_9GAST|nr:hypothetical protein RRG08_048735 [Elysia crispata]
MMVVNAWLRYRSHAQVLKVRPMRLAEFQGRLATQLVSPKAPVGRSRILSPAPRLSTVHHRCAPLHPVRFDWTATITCQSGASQGSAAKQKTVLLSAMSNVQSATRTSASTKAETASPGSIQHSAI